jgi:molybdopterin-guanine dinucleotide biosynthesis protein A
MRSSGIVLAGGASIRMGLPKARLAWGDLTLLARTVEVVAQAAGRPVIVVRAPEQKLPELPPWAEVVEDARPGRGPLEGLAAGLRALAGRAEVAFVSATDVPFLSADFVGAVIDALGAEDDAAVPLVQGASYPLSAAYRIGTVTAVERQLARDELRLRSLLDDLRVRWLDEPTLRAVDPDLDSLVNVNAPEDWEQAQSRMRAGWE